MTNRLNLDWSLETSKERSDFINRYAQLDIFKNHPLNSEELKQCAEYILWGKDEDGKNGVQKKDYQISTKKGTWDKKDEESLDALLETPTFNENTILRPGQAQIKFSKETFSRKLALEKAPEGMKEIFKNLFREIDILDLTLNYYDLAHGKRKNLPREELLKHFTNEEQENLKEKATHITPYKYLKLRHDLVELRRSQFSLKDNYSCPIQINDQYKIIDIPEKIIFNSDINVYPFGIIEDNNRIFIDFKDLIPSNFSEQQLKIIISKYWKQQDNKTKLYFDFENEDHVYKLLLNYSDFEQEINNDEIEDTLEQLLNTLQYYINQANLNDCQKEILMMKIQKKKNQDIIEYINKKYNKSYTANYISTIFCQKIVNKINECATYHKELVLNLPFEENFKKCSTCGQLLFKHSHNFVKKTRSKDGFTNRCKECDKKDRQIKRGEQINEMYNR